MKKLLGILFLLIILGAVGVLGYLGMIPGLSSVLGTNKPRDLGVKWTEADRLSVHSKSGLTFESLPENTSSELSIQRTGSHPVSNSFTSTEITATMNDRKWRYWPYKNTQMKFNADGSVEVSGQLIKSRIPAYGSAIGIPKEALEFAMKFLPSDPVYYVKGKAALTENKLSLFEPQSLQIGRMSIPLGVILSFNPDFFNNLVLAAESEDMLSQLSSVSNKRALIIDFIQQRLSKINGFYAKSANFSENKLNFEGTIPDKVMTVN